MREPARLFSGGFGQRLEVKFAAAEVEFGFIPGKCFVKARSYRTLYRSSLTMSFDYACLAENSDVFGNIVLRNFKPMREFANGPRRME